MNGEIDSVKLACIAFSVAFVFALFVADLVDRYELVQRFRIWQCKRKGHVPVADDRGLPVTSFYLCLRCGKVGERRP